MQKVFWVIGITTLFMSLSNAAAQPSGNAPKVIAAALTIDAGPESGHSLAISPDGKYLVAKSSTGPDNLGVWDLGSGKRLAALGKGHGSVTPVTISPDGKTFAYANLYDIMICRLPDGRELQVLKQDDRKFSNYLRTLAFLPSGEQLVVGGKLGLLGFKPGDSTLVFDWPNTDDEVAAMSQVFDNGRKVATGSDKGVIKIWDLASGKTRMLESQLKEKIGTIAVSPDGKRLAAVGLYSNIEIYDIHTGKQQKVLKAAGGWKPGLFLNDSITLVYADGENFEAKGADRHFFVMENVIRGERTHLLRGHIVESAFGIALSADGKKLATASEDGIVKIWNVPQLP